MARRRDLSEVSSVDDDVLAAAQSGDRDAFAQLVRREAGRLLATARRLTDSEQDAKDCVQETFLLAHRRLHQFQRRSKFSSWLHRILVNVALGKSRKRSRQPEVSLEDLMPVFDERDCREEPLGSLPEDADVLLEREDVRVAVRDAIAHLPDGHREILLLRDIEGRTTAEAADALGITETAAKVRLHRARAALKRLLEPVMGVEGHKEPSRR